MIVFVRFNLGPVLLMELQEEVTVAQLKEEVAKQQGVRGENLRVLFAGRELRSSSTLQGCDLPEQSTVHVVLPPPPGSSSSSRLLLHQEARAPGGGEEEQEEQDSLTRLDFSSSRLPPTSSSLPLLVEGGDEGGGDEGGGNEGGGNEGGGDEGGGDEGGGDEGGGAEPREEEQPARLQGSTFFVYCKRCRSVQPGKLRVCCGRCRETTMTITTDPSCWDDVLVRGRIRGVCQSDACHGDEAEFYMKCASHPTAEDDVSAALDLVVVNGRHVPCVACRDVTDLVLVFQCLERHVICLDCFRRYCQTRLDERQFVYDAVIGYSLPCAAGCADSLIKELHHFRILGDEQYGRYQRYGAEECLLVIGGLMCPSPGCGAGLVPPGDSRLVECDRRLGCGLVFCRLCREEYHEGACPTQQATPTADALQGFVVDEEASLRGRWDRASLRLLQESTKRCPQCSVPVERNGGCMHMRCTLCRAEWCWVCGVAWNTECMGNHWFG